METVYIIEADTTFHSLFAYKAERGEDAGDYRTYRRLLGADPEVLAIDPAKFFGQLNALLPTAETLNNAPAMKLIKEVIQEADRGTAISS